MNAKYNYLSSMSSYVLRWYRCDNQTIYGGIKKNMITYAVSQGGDLFDHLYNMITFARVNDNLRYENNHTKIRSSEKSKDIIRMLSSSGVAMNNYSPYRIGYVGEGSSMTAKVLGEELLTNHIDDIDNMGNNSTELVIAVSTLHEKLAQDKRYIEKIAPKISSGGFLIIRENNIHTNRGPSPNTDTIATEFLDAMFLARDIIMNVDGTIIPCSSIVDDVLVNSSGNCEKIITLNKNCYRKMKCNEEEKYIIQYDSPLSDVVSANVSNSYLLDWKRYKKILTDNGALNKNCYRRMKSWDLLMEKNGFITSFEPIIYSEPNPHQVFYKLYQKI